MISIKQEHLNRIKRALGGENLLLDDDEIKELCILPALEKYFTKFPLKEKQIIASVSSEYSLDFPDDENVFGVYSVKVSDTGYYMGSGIPFYDLIAYNSTGGSTYYNRASTGAYGAKAGYNPNSLLQQNILERQRLKTNANYNSTISYNVDIENRVLNIYTTLEGKLNIIWAKMSQNFDDIKLSYRQDVIDLCQANLLQDFVYHTEVYEDSGLDTSINVDALQSRADALREKVEEKWDQIPDVVMLNFS